MTPLAHTTHIHQTWTKRKCNKLHTDFQNISLLVLQLFAFLLNTNPDSSRALFIIMIGMKAITNTFVTILYNIRGNVHLGYFGQTFP